MTVACRQGLTSVLPARCPFAVASRLRLELSSGAACVEAVKLVGVMSEVLRRFDLPVLLDVLGRSVERGRVVLELPQPEIAATTQPIAHLASRMIVIRLWLRCEFEADWARHGIERSFTTRATPPACDLHVLSVGCAQPNSV